LKISTYSYNFEAWKVYRSFLSNSDREDEQIRVLIEGLDAAESSSHIEVTIPIHRKRENIEYRLLLYLITVGAKAIGPFFFTCELIARARMQEVRLVMYNV
jgi:hypothetical protein